jgi:hypothetical protein
MGALERSPQAMESTLHEVYNFDYPWNTIPLGMETYLIEFPSTESLENATNTIPLGMETYLIEFPSTESLENATTGQLLFGSKNTLLIK